MKTKHRFRLGLLTLIFCLGLMLPIPVRAADIYFTSVDDALLPLTSATMPVWSGGKLYVPYTIFDRNTTGINLGINCIYNRSSSTLTLYTPQDMLLLVFDLDAGTCRDEVTDITFDAKAITRSGQPFLPINFVCDYFGLNRSYSRIDEGYLIRIKSDNAVLSDSKFIDAAGNLIEQRLREYNQSLPPAAEPEQPAVTPDPPNEPDADVRTYLAFRCEQMDHLTAILDSLDAVSIHAAFFCSPHILTEDPDLVRRIMGSGHSLGLLADGETEDASREILAEGSTLLARTTHSRTTLAYVPDSQSSALEKDGWVCWDESYLLTPSDTISPYTFAANTLNRLEGHSRAAYLTMDADGNTARVLPHLLRQMQFSRFVIGTPMETRL